MSLVQNGKKRYLKAHRFAWELKYGAISSNQFVLHRCDNPPCCNTDHLFLGTAADNSRDMVSKGRSPAGERSGKAKLSTGQVEEIKTLYSSGKYKQKDLATVYGITRSQVSHIVNRKCWT